MGIADVHLEFLAVETVGVGLWHAFGVRFDNQVNFTELTRTSRLLFVTIVGACSLCDGLTIRNLWLEILDFELFVVLDSPFQSAQVEFALSRYDCLLEFFRLLNFPSRVFFVHSGEYFAEFL